MCRYTYIIRIVLFALFSNLIFGVEAQYSLTAPYNNPRGGDEIIKQQIDYKDPGRIGKNVLWDFSSLSEVQPEYKVDYSSFGKEYPNCLYSTAHNARFYYSIAGDSLYLTGYEDRECDMNYNNPELVMSYPLGIGAIFSDTIKGTGRYCSGQKMEILSRNNSIMDAYGMIILPGGDTLRHVVRVKTVKEVFEVKLLHSDTSQQQKSDSLASFMSGDTLKFRTETFHWYSDGYRYPVFESIHRDYYTPSDEYECFRTSFFYHPDNHKYLAQDTLNTARLEELYTEILKPDTQPDGDDPENMFLYNYYPNPVNENLTIEYYIYRPTKVALRLFSVDGVLLDEESLETKEAGVYSRNFDMTRYLPGHYLLVICHDQTNESAIIIKE